MAQGPWGTGTWDDAKWDSLPIFGNQATGGVGSPSVAVSAAPTSVNATGVAGTVLGANFNTLTGVLATGAVGSFSNSLNIALASVSATGAVGTIATSSNIALTGVNGTGLVGSIANGLSVGLTGVQASGLAGSESESVTVSLDGVAATGFVGSFATITKAIQLTGVQATGAVGDLTPSKPIIYIDDTHDPGPDKLKKQLKREQEKNKKRRDEIIAAYERIVEGKIPEEIIAPYVETFVTIATKQNVTLTDIQKMVSNLDKMQLIWDDHIESDDEEILLL
jgi:hypothetical protein